MQKLISLKHLAEIPRRLSTSCKSFVSRTEKNSKQIFESPVTQPHSRSQSNFDFYRSWMSHYGLPGKYYGFLANPVFFKRIVSYTPLKIPSRVDFDRGLHFLKFQFQRQNFQFSPKINSSQKRRWISWYPTTDGVIMGLIAANVGVYLLWRIADSRFMLENFMISVENVKNGRVHTMITSAFSHMDLEHLFSNMIGLYFFGSSIGKIFGPNFILKLYLAGAFGGSVFYLLHHAYMTPKSQGAWYEDPSRIPGLGASGAVNAIMLLYIFLFPKATIYLEFLIPVPAMLMGAFLVGHDAWRIMKGDSKISGSAHLGGAVVAALAWARIRKGLI